MFPVLISSITINRYKACKQKPLEFSIFKRLKESWVRKFENNWFSASRIPTMYWAGLVEGKYGYWTDVGPAQAPWPETGRARHRAGLWTEWGRFV